MRIALSLLLALALGGALASCDPDLPGRACDTDDDCFRDEICQGTSCVSGERSGDHSDQDVDASPGDDASPDGEDAGSG